MNTYTMNKLCLHIKEFKPQYARNFMDNFSDLPICLKQSIVQNSICQKRKQKIEFDFLYKRLAKRKELTRF